MSTLLDQLIVVYPAAKRTTLRGMVADGRVLVDGVRARSLKQPVASGSRVEVTERAVRRVDVSPLEIVHEDAEVLVVNKPPGLLTSTVARERRPTAWAIVRRYLDATDRAARPGLIHRLDADAGGLLVFSKSDSAYRSLKAQFRRHSVDRVYSAVVWGVPSPRRGRIESRLVETAGGMVHRTRDSTKGDPAVTDYEVLKDDGRRALLRVRLHTGRKHQIRAHLSQRGWPIVGDEMYGGAGAGRMIRRGFPHPSPLPKGEGANPRPSPHPKGEGRLMLRAVVLAFDHPRTARRVKFELPAFEGIVEGDEQARPAT